MNTGTPIWDGGYISSILPATSNGPKPRKTFKGMKALKCMDNAFILFISSSENFNHSIISNTLGLIFSMRALRFNQEQKSKGKWNKPKQY